MATKAQIIETIRSSPLDEDDIVDIVTACTMITLSNALIGAGMDLLAKATRTAMDDAAELAASEATDSDDIA